MTFERWMREVDAELIGEVGMSSSDLPDSVFWHDMYDDDISPRAAAIEYLEKEGYTDFLEGFDA